MKQILLVTGIITILMLGGCTVSPSMLGDNNIVGIGGGGGGGTDTPGSLIPPDTRTSSSAVAGSPGATGSIVPLRDAGAVVDMPDSSARMQGSSSFQQGESQSVEEEAGEQILSAEERHRRELINRGDLQEGQMLPAEE